MNKKHGGADIQENIIKDLLKRADNIIKDTFKGLLKQVIIKDYEIYLKHLEKGL